MNTLHHHTNHTLKFIPILLVFSLLAFAMLVPAYARPISAEADFSAVDAYLEGQRQALGIPGMALAIVQDDHIAFLGSYGEADSDGRPVTPQTPFQIGSTAKSMTALAIMQLVEVGQVELDAPVKAYLSWFTTADPVASAQITIRHLLNQTSGLSTVTGRGEFAASDLSDQAIENSVRALANAVLVSPPGTTYHYSNSNFTILGLVVQVVSGQSYERYMQEHIFDPLEMRHSFTAQEPAEQDGLASGYVTFFGLQVTRRTPFNRGSLPNGYIFSSAEDMGHYMIAQLNDGRYGEVSVLSPQGMAAMHTAAVAAEDGSYAMAWHVGDIAGVPAIFHSGDNANYATFILLVPEQELGVVLLINVNGFSVNNAARQLSTGVLAILLGKTPAPYAKDQQVYQAEGSVIVPSLLALLWTGWQVFRFFRRGKRAIPPRRGFMWWAFVLVLPVLVNLVLLAVLLVGVPTLWGLPLNGIAQMFPDHITLIALSTTALVVWGVLGTVLTLSQPQAAR